MAASASIQQVCLSEELGPIMESTEIDINMKIALVIAR